MQEKDNSRRTRFGAGGTATEIELTYTVSGSTDADDVRAHVVANAGLTFEGLPRRDGDIEPVAVDTEAERGLWDVRVIYGLTGGGSGTTNEAPLVQFDTTGGTVHVTSGTAENVVYNADGYALPSLGTNIGDQGTSLEGVDITVPSMKFSVAVQIPADKLTAAYIKKLVLLSGKVNAANFTVWGLGTYQAGELLFLGANGSVRMGDTIHTVQMSFAHQENTASVDAGNGITVAAKKGWQYLWKRYSPPKPIVDGNENQIGLQQIPIAAFVSTPYREGDFGDLIW